MRCSLSTPLLSAALRKQPEQGGDCKKTPHFRGLCNFAQTVDDRWPSPGRAYFFSTSADCENDRYQISERTNAGYVACRPTQLILYRAVGLAGSRPRSDSLTARPTFGSLAAGSYLRGSARKLGRRAFRSRCLRFLDLEQCWYVGETMRHCSLEPMLAALPAAQPMLPLHGVKTDVIQGRLERRHFIHRCHGNPFWQSSTYAHANMIASAAGCGELASRWSATAASAESRRPLRTLSLMSVKYGAPMV